MQRSSLCWYLLRSHVVEPHGYRHGGRRVFNLLRLVSHCKVGGGKKTTNAMLRSGKLKDAQLGMIDAPGITTQELVRLTFQKLFTAQLCIAPDFALFTPSQRTLY